MDDQRSLNNSNRRASYSAPSPSSTTSCHQDQISFLLGHFPTSASYSPCCPVGSASHRVEQTPLPSCYPPSAGAADEGTSAGEEALGAGEGFGVVRSLGLEQGSLLHGKRRPREVDFEAHECESEDGVEVSEEPVKPAPARSSGSKRSRAAEVHNLSEKRRRSRINEKMKALQNLIPNSNKTDKASMLDEAIEYLKQLQLQVQMLSMRNGLNLHPMFLPGSLQPLQASQMCMGFSTDSGTALNMAVGMLPLNQDSAPQNSFDLSNRCTSSHPSIVVPNVTDITNPETTYGIESSHSHHGPFQLPVSAEGMLTVDMVPRQQVAAGQAVRPLPGNEMKSIAESTTEHFSGQASALVDRDHLEECILGRERSEDMLSKDQDNQILVQHFHSLQTGRNFTGADVKAESPGF